MARKKALAQADDGKVVDLFHTTPVLDAHVMDLLEKDASDASVGLPVARFHQELFEMR